MFGFQCGENSGPFGESHVDYITHIFKLYRISSIYLLRLTSLALLCRYTKRLLISL